MCGRILVPLDGSVCGEHALREGLRLARKVGAEITLLHVLHPEQSVYTRRESGVFEARQVEHAKDAAHNMLAQAAETAYLEGVIAKTVLIEDPETHPVRAILEAEASSDLTVLATHGRRGLRHFFLGSVTEAVLRRSPKPHLVVNGALALSRAADKGGVPAAEPQPP